MALSEIRQLMEVAFDGDFSEDDWQHTIGGVHLTRYAGDLLVAHASVVERVLICGDMPMRTGYVEGVAVHPGFRRLGYGRSLMLEVAKVITASFELGALSTSEAGEALYTGLGWLRWLGPTFVDTPKRGRVATPEDDGGVFVLPVRSDVDLNAPITCDWRAGDVW